MEVFNIENLTFKYPTKEKAALTDITLQIDKGEFILLCGQSGCGKTTLIKHLKPSLTPHGQTQGNIFYKSTTIKQVSTREDASEIGYVLQNPDNQIVTDKVWHELAFGLENLGIDKQQIRLRVAEMANFFGIQNWFYNDTASLSGGQKQLLNLASIIVMGVEVLILDEPTSQLDPISAVDFLETLNKINDELGITIILTEHRLEEVFKLVDKVIVMQDSKILFYDTPHNVCKNLIETQHPMANAMPTPARIAAALTHEELPFTIKSGRNLLYKLIGSTNILADNLIEKPIDTNFNILTLKDVFFRYTKDGNDILKGLSINVAQGEIYAILGGNGTGKSTLLNVIAKNLRPYRGKIKSSTKSIALLPQDPQVMFIKDTVSEELANNEISKLLNISHLLNFHPFDLSGGEQQKVALAKILLSNPDILLLDEPTKGLDCYFKAELAQILASLNKTIILVSHDIEFCAKYASRCGLYFDGQIISEGPPREFFSNNYFYTTSASRMCRHIISNAVTVKEVIETCQNQLK
ncbi:MAG: hypothetical protein ATN34_00475 [Epulopiscium sp. Nele67-Bin002]|nr:MAG: hypothetical protein ATN34_00475 [Epulopiscium sp. Nele67-Bin002]